MRIDGHLLGFTKRLANPQSRGAFGEEALRNQLELLGLTEHRDYRRQVKEDGGRRRIDYALHLRGTTVGLDPKFALDPDLDGLSEALASGDDARLVPFARKLVARAKELARKEYWAHLERSPGFVLMYVPLEGVQAVLSALPNFSYEKFALEHGVYIVTPLQLGTTLGVIADIAHAEKRTEEIEEVHRGLISLDQELAKFCDQYAKHGRQLAASVASYNGGAAMLSPRGGLGRIVKQVRGYSRRLFARPETPQFEPVRDNVEELARGYEESARQVRRAARVGLTNRGEQTSVEWDWASALEAILSDLRAGQLQLFSVERFRVEVENLVVPNPRCADALSAHPADLAGVMRFVNAARAAQGLEAVASLSLRGSRRRDYPGRPGRALRSSAYRSARRRRTAVTHTGTSGSVSTLASQVADAAT